MLLLTEAILHLRKNAPVFEQRVAGTQSFAAATNEDADIKLPACFIVPMSDTADEPIGGGSAQMVTERFATIVVADNSKDPRSGRGLSAEITLRTAKNQLIKALGGWSPISMAFVMGVRYARSQHLAMNNARIWHQYEWVCSYYVNGDPESQDSYEAIEKVIRGYWPEIEASKVRMVATSALGQGPINPGDDSTFEKVFEAITDTPPDWIKYTSHVPTPGLQPPKPGDVLFSGTREVDP